MALGSVWVLAELSQGRAATGALVLLTRARSLGTAAVEAVCFGPEAGDAVAELGRYGATTVHLSTDPAFTELLFGGPAADTLAALVAEHRPDLALFRPKSFAAAEAPDAFAPRVVEVQAVIRDCHRRARVVDRSVEVAAGPKLEEAEVVVSGGRGIQDAGNFELLREVAELLHGAVGASRAVVDAGWAPYSLQVGQTGKNVKPTVYIACGISGAMQHTVGMRGTQKIVAINKDPRAPIFKLADLGIVGDALTVLRQLREELRSRPG